MKPRALSLSFCIVFFLLLISLDSESFSIYGYREHQLITRQALGPASVSLMLSNGTPVSFSSSAIEEVVDLNIFVDDVQIDRFHFDNHSFLAASSRIVDLRAQIEDSLQLSPPDGRRARATLGIALHTIQDFYAHTTWVEMGNSVIEPNLGIRSVGSLPSGPFTACGSDGNLISLPVFQLTSGYYDGLVATLTCQNAMFPANSCIHGTVVSNGCGINKDLPFRSGYPAARALAVLASSRFVELVAARVRAVTTDVAYDRALCALTGNASCASAGGNGWYTSGTTFLEGEVPFGSCASQSTPGSSNVSPSTTLGTFAGVGGCKVNGHWVPRVTSVTQAWGSCDGGSNSIRIVTIVDQNGLGTAVRVGTCDRVGADGSSSSGRLFSTLTVDLNTGRAVMTQAQGNSLLSVAPPNPSSFQQQCAGTAVGTLSIGIATNCP